MKPRIAPSGLRSRYCRGAYDDPAATGAGLLDAPFAPALRLPEPSETPLARPELAAQRLAPRQTALLEARLSWRKRSALKRPRLPVAACSCAHSTRQLSRSTLMLEPFDAPTDWFVYGHLHLILALPTLTLLSLFPPLQQAKPLQKTTSYAFIVFIVLIGVGQSFIWDSYGASQGFW